MSTRDLVRVALALLVGGCAGAGATRVAMRARISTGRDSGADRGLDISVGPTAWVPPGKGTAATGAGCTSRSA